MHINTIVVGKLLCNTSSYTDDSNYERSTKCFVGRIGVAVIELLKHLVSFYVSLAKANGSIGTANPVAAAAEVVVTTSTLMWTGLARLTALGSMRGGADIRTDATG